METVLSHIKRKHEEAQLTVQSASAEAAKAEADLGMVKQLQLEKLEEIKQFCR